MGDDLRGVGTAMVNELGQPTIVGFDVGLTCSNLLPLEPESAEVKGHLALLGEVIPGTWIFWHKHTDDTDPTGSLGRCD